MSSALQLCNDASSTPALQGRSSSSISELGLGATRLALFTTSKEVTFSERGRWIIRELHRKHLHEGGGVSL
jgi:hypothetical protein